MSDWTPLIIDGGKSNSVLRQLRESLSATLTEFQKLHPEVNLWDITQELGILTARGIIQMLENEGEKPLTAKVFGELMGRLFDGWINGNTHALDQRENLE